MRKPILSRFIVRCSIGIVLLALAPGLTIQAQELHVTEADAKGAAISKQMPEYPPMARQLKVTGKVELEVVIAADGSVEDVRISSGNSMLTRPCAKAVHDWRFKPFLQDGKPVRAVAPLTFEFK